MSSISILSLLIDVIRRKSRWKNLSKVEKNFNLSSQVRKEVLWGGQGRADGDGTEDPGVSTSFILVSFIQIFLYLCLKDYNEDPGVSDSFIYKSIINKNGKEIFCDQVQLLQGDVPRCLPEECQGSDLRFLPGLFIEKASFCLKSFCFFKQHMLDGKVFSLVIEKT